MSEFLILWQLFIAALTGCFAFVLARWANRRIGQSDFSAIKQRIKGWPSPAPRFWFLLAPFISLADRWSRPSARLAKELATVGENPTLVDREFTVFRNALSLLAGFLTGVVLAFASLFFNFSIALVFVFSVFSGSLVFLLVSTRISDRYRLAQRQVARSFPNFLDVLSLTLESGKNFQSALQMSAQQLSTQGASAGLRLQLLELIRDIRASGSRTVALQRFSDRLELPEIVQFSAAVIAADRQGVSVSALLRRQAEQLRSSQALAAERHAMKLPVKLLAPLAICIFPCTFLVLAFPLAIRLSGSGLF